jgi:hypothetical protein
LEQLLASGHTIGLRHAVEIVGDLAVVLDDLYANGMYYGVLTPSAVRLDLAGRAWLLPADSPEVPTSTGGYLAPEQRHSHLGKPVDGRADQYALAIIAYELLTGERREARVEGQSSGPVILNEADLRPGRALRAGVNSAANAAIRQALVPDAAARHASAGAFVAALAEALSLPDDHAAALPIADHEARGRAREHASKTPLARVLPAAGLVAAAVLGTLFAQRFASSGAGGVMTVLGQRAPQGVNPNISGTAADSVALSNASSSSPARGSNVPDATVLERDSRGGTRAPATRNVPGGAQLGAPSASGARSAVLAVSAPGARNVVVLIDGTPVGPPPLRLPVVPGVHVVSLSRGSSTRTVMLRTGDTVAVRLDTP